MRNDRGKEKRKEAKANQKRSFEQNKLRMMRMICV